MSSTDTALPQDNRQAREAESAGLPGGNASGNPPDLRHVGAMKMLSGSLMLVVCALLRDGPPSWRHVAASLVLLMAVYLAPRFEDR